MKHVFLLFITLVSFQLGISQTVVDVIVGSDVHETLEDAVIAAGLADDLSDSTALFTVFAPTDSAFSLLPDGLLDSLLADTTGQLANILLYHVIGDTVASTALMDSMTAATLLGEDVLITIDTSGAVFVNDAMVISADLPASNGIVHVIDAVLIPPMDTMVVDTTVMIDSSVVDIVVGSEVHTVLETAVIEAGLVETLSGEGPFTIFAPTDSAFAALPEGLLDTLLADPEGELTNILLYHVLGAAVVSDSLSDGQMVTTLQGSDVTVTIDSSGVFINDAMVTLVDLQADNGVVHVIDAVLVPPVDTMVVVDSSVVDIIVGSEIHTVLETAVIEAGLVETLSGEGPFTVFAPTDSAFAALPEGLLDTLLLDPTGELTNILLYHVLGATVVSDSLSDGQTAMTLQGTDVTVTIDSSGVFINDAMVILADLLADNGVVHVIDAVLVPTTTVGTPAELASTVGIKVFPNPTSDLLEIQFPQTLSKTKNIKLLTLEGRELRSWDTQAYTETLSLKDINRGTYFLLIESEAGKGYFQRIVVN
ncbi:MAG: fasciclin domain-containing protein [Bacteroidota bacterium]